MTRLLLDTSGYSAFMRGHSEVQGALREADEICFSPVILGELLAGFFRGRRRKKNESELKTFLESPRVKIFDVNSETAERYAVILNSLWKAGTPIPTNDIWIAATAMQHGLHLLTTDAHYQKVSQIIVDYCVP
ncbi:MAG: type II toxin-antitoxin system VapC family toxin [Deltaproteobacteria bacterium]|nr:type II toxin-antitoxin system VapC family toxin [Deltaproteobacteria bacterium]